MSDFFEPLRLDLDEFTELVQALDLGIGRSAVALVVDDRYGYRELEVFDPSAIGWSTEQWGRFEPIVQDLDQLMVFAFADAPRSTIESWAKDASEDAQVALDKVQVMRDKMPRLAKLWQAKTDSIAPTLSSLRYELQSSPADGAGECTLYLSASISGLTGRIVPGSVERVSMKLWPSDLARLKRTIDVICEQLYETSKDSDDTAP